MAAVDYSEKRVLLVESSGNMRAAIYYMLREMGIQNIRAITVSSRFLSIISEESFDIILLGHNIRDAVAGMQLLEEARFRGYMKPSTSWVFITSDASQETVLHAIDSQPDAVLTKPFTIDELKARLDMLMLRRAAFKSVDAALDLGDLDSAARICLTQFKPGERNYDEAMTLACKLLLKLKRFEQVIKIGESLYWRTRNKEAGVYWAQALIALDQLAEAKELLLEVIEVNPLYITAYDLLAIAHEREGDLDAARDIVQLASSKSPLGIPRQMELGRLATQTKQLDVAAGAYRKSINLGHKSCYRSADAYLRLANVNRLQLVDGDHQSNLQREREFEELLQQAAVHFRSDPALAVRSALLRAEMSKSLGHEEHATKFMQEARRENAALAEPLDLERERDGFNAKPIAKARKAVQEGGAAKIAKRDVDMSQKVNRQGVKHYVNGRISQALRHFGLALDYDYANVRALLNLAQIYLELARDDKAKREERLRMLERYLHLASKLPLADEEKQKQQMLVKMKKAGCDALPEGPLGLLLR